MKNNEVTPILRVMVCPSLKPRSSLGVVSGACACLVSSVSCFTHLERTREDDKIRCKKIVRLPAALKTGYTYKCTMALNR